MNGIFGSSKNSQITPKTPKNKKWKSHEKKPQMKEIKKTIYSQNTNILKKLINFKK